MRMTEGQVVESNNEVVPINKRHTKEILFF